MRKKQSRGRRRNSQKDSKSACVIVSRSCIMSTVCRSLSAFLLSGILQLASQTQTIQNRHVLKRNQSTSMCIWSSSYGRDTLAYLHHGILPCLYTRRNPLDNTLA